MMAKRCAFANCLENDAVPSLNRDQTHVFCEK